MARTIGAKAKARVEALVREARALGIHDGIQEYVFNHLPSDTLDKWEGAYSEVERIVSDTLIKIVHVEEVHL